MRENETEEKQRKGRWKLPVAFLLGCAVTFAGTQAYSFYLENTEKENIIHALIDKYYLHEIDEETLEDGKYKGMLSALGDPYTTYMTVSETNERIMQNEGTYRGIGVVLSQNTETGELTITRCYADSPAEAAGVKGGDILYQIDGNLVSDMELSEVTDYIKNAGEEGIVLTLIREGEQEYLNITVVPGAIQSEMVQSRMLGDGIGYLAIYDFTETTYEQFHTQIEELKEEGMTGMIVDLRNNTGGLMTSVTDILDSILPEGVMVYTMDKEGNRKDYYSSGKTPLEMPMVVLVNEYTASASEIFAGAVRDYDMAQLVGTKTYGKGVVQSTFYLKDGSAVKLTSASYYTPNGTNINGTGLEPDVVVELDQEPDDDGYIHDNQLNTAIEVMETMR